MNMRRIHLFRVFSLLLPVLAVLVMQTAMLATMAHARVAPPQTLAQGHDHTQSGHHHASKVTHQQETPCHETGDLGKIAHPPCLALCCLALPMQPEILVLPQAAGLPGVVLLPVLSGVQTIPPSPPPRG